jgi:(Z)-2-((N-methylformamido)methylene)-5-hydroxybutyrolactone dehydrogenase
MSKAIKAATIWVSTSRTCSYALPFGGMKQSGIGR